MFNSEDFLFKAFVDAYSNRKFHTGSFNCYVSKVYPREDLFEISDSSYSVKCSFMVEGLDSLKKTLLTFS